MRRATVFFALAGTQCVVLAGLLLHAAWFGRAGSPAMRERRALARSLQLTDLCLSTEARYTRHPSQADLGTAFQDHPAALEHFPSGSFLGPSIGIRSGHAALD